MMANDSQTDRQTNSRLLVACSITSATTDCCCDVIERAMTKGGRAKKRFFEKQNKTKRAISLSHF